MNTDTGGAAGTCTITAAKVDVLTGDFSVRPMALPASCCDGSADRSFADRSFTVPDAAPLSMSELSDQLQVALDASYRIERELGGGMSRVFVAEDLRLGRTVVLLLCC